MESVSYLLKVFVNKYILILNLYETKNNYTKINMLCLGVSLGSLISGYLFKKIGTSRTYLVLSVLALFVCVIQILTTRTMVSYRKPKIKDTNLVSTEIKEISLLKESRV